MRHRAKNRSVSAAGWNLIESNEDIFNDMIERYGIKGVYVQQIIDLAFFSANDPSTCAIILAFDINNDRSPKKPDVYDKDADNIVFSHQVVVNSCATQALLNTLTNLDIEKGGLIQRFIDSTNNMDSTNRGVVLGYTREFELIHNSYEDWNPGKSGTILGGGPSYGAGSTYHFVSYIPKNGFIWELDSLRRYPTKLVMIDEDENWLELLGSIITEKFAYIKGEASMLGVFKDPITRNDEQIAFIDQLSREVTESDKPISSYDLSAFNIIPIDQKTEQDETDFNETNILPTDNTVDIIDEGPETFSNHNTPNETSPPAISSTSTSSTENEKEFTEFEHIFENYTTEREDNDRATSPIPIINKRRLIDDEEVETLKRAMVMHRRKLCRLGYYRYSR